MPIIAVVVDADAGPVVVAGLFAVDVVVIGAVLRLPPIGKAPIPEALDMLGGSPEMLMTGVLDDTATCAHVPAVTTPLTFSPIHKPRPAAWHCASEMQGDPTVMGAAGVVEVGEEALLGAT